MEWVMDLDLALPYCTNIHELSDEKPTDVHVPHLMYVGGFVCDVTGFKLLLLAAWLSVLKGLAE
jgi:hypothetical protein